MNVSTSRYGCRAQPNSSPASGWGTLKTHPGTSARLSSSTPGIEEGRNNDGRTDGQHLIFVKMGQYPASRAAHGWLSRQRNAAPCSPMETSLGEQVALQQCWMGSSRGWSCDLSIGSASHLRCRLRATLRTHLHWALRYQSQPDVYRLDLALPWRCAYQAKHVDGRIASSRGGGHPPRRSSRRAQAGRSVWRRLRSVPEAGSSIPLVAGVERQLPETLQAILPRTLQPMKNSILGAFMGA